MENLYDDGTSLYTREYLYVKRLKENGELGKIQYLKGDHMQNMSLEGWGDYWQGFPPFWYGTHVLSPILDLAGTTAKSVRCLGSGRVNKERAEHYGCPYAVETATFRLRNSDIVAEAHRCLFETVRQVRECFDVYGDKMSFEWEPTVDEGHTIFTGIDDFTKFTAPDTAELLPKEIQKYTLRSAIKDPNQPSFIQGSGHGGSHPHLCNEFVNAIVEGRQPYMDAVRSANYTAAYLRTGISRPWRSRSRNTGFCRRILSCLGGTYGKKFVMNRDRIVQHRYGHWYRLG